MGFVPYRIFPLGDMPERGPRRHHVTLPGRRGELPLAVQIEGFHDHASWQEEAKLLGDRGQGVLQAVVDLPQQPGPQRDRQHLLAELDGVAHL